METVRVCFPGRRLDDPPLALDVPVRLLTTPGIERDGAEETRNWQERPLRLFSNEHYVFQQYYREVALQDYIARWSGLLEANARQCEVSGDLEPTAPPDPAVDVTEAIRRRAMELGFAVVGFAPVDPRYTYLEKREWVQFDSAICLALEQNYETTQQIPSLTSEMQVWAHNVELGDLGLQLGDFIRSLGYRAQIHPPNRSTCVIHPYFIAAGLGQMGANGQLLSPHFGSRARLALITTDAPVRHGRPVDFGITQLCQECTVCARRCPGRAIRQKPIWWRGIKKFKITLQRCMPMLPRYDACAICMKVCPVQKFGLKAVLDHYIATDGEILGKGTPELEGYTLPDKGYFGPGALPKYTRAELEVPDGPIDGAPTSNLIVSME